MPEQIYKRFIDPLLQQIGHSEGLHTAAREIFHYAENPLLLRIIKHSIEKGQQVFDERLHVPIDNNIILKNPIGVGAGWDKYGKSEATLFELFNFSTIEVGTVTPQPQPGNPKPRQKMVAPGVCIQSLGFPSPGMEKVAKNLDVYKGSLIPIGISIGKNRITPMKSAIYDYSSVVDRLYDNASYFVINVSSPNTPGLRRLQEKEFLQDIIQSVLTTMDKHGGKKALYIKIAPELSFERLDEVIGLVETYGLKGIIASNTTNNSEIINKYVPGLVGGLSGDDDTYRRKVRTQIEHIYKQSKEKIQIVGVGGVKDTATALDYIMHGASWLQVVTAIRGEGPMVSWRINTGILKFIEEHGVGNISELVGIKS